jgi:F-type H+-transporting ATPase subunit epsilon
MKVEILTPEDLIYQGEASITQLPGLDGLFEILNNHAPMITVLSEGNVKLVETNNSPVFFTIKGGVVEVLANKVLVLAENCKRK